MLIYLFQEVKKAKTINPFQLVMGLFVSACIYRMRHLIDAFYSYAG